MVEVKISNTEIQRALRDIKKYSTEKQKQVVNEMVSTAYRIDKKQKQALRKHSSTSGRNYSLMIASNVVVVNRAAKQVRIENNHKAAGFFETGTRAHPIPKTPLPQGKVLATLWEYTNKSHPPSIDSSGNQWAVFGKQVQHPGTKPKPFFFKPAEQEKPLYIERLKKDLDERE